MIINVIATGSQGNLYEIIDSRGNSLLLEAGVGRAEYAKYREGEEVPEMCIITHKHGDHAYYAGQFEMICEVHRWKRTAQSESFKAFGYVVEHGGVLCYAYLIKCLKDDDFLFFMTDAVWSDEYFKQIFDDLKKYNVRKFLIECNYNDYLYHLATDEQRVGCDRHFSDNDVVRFVREVGTPTPRIITIHGSNRLSGDAYTKKYIGSKFPLGRVLVASGAKNGVKNLFKI